MIYINIIILLYALLTMVILIVGCIMEYSIRKNRIRSHRLDRGILDG